MPAFLSFFLHSLCVYFSFFSDGKYRADKRATDRVFERNKLHVSFPEPFAIKTSLYIEHIVDKLLSFQMKTKERKEMNNANISLILMN